MLLVPNRYLNLLSPPLPLPLKALQTKGKCRVIRFIVALSAIIVTRVPFFIIIYLCRWRMLLLGGQGCSR